MRTRQYQTQLSNIKPGHFRNFHIYRSYCFSFFKRFTFYTFVSKLQSIQNENYTSNSRQN